MMPEHPQPVGGDPRADHPELYRRTLWVGSRVLAGTVVMFFFAFAFAYVYLRSLDGARFRPAGVDPPQVYGVLIAGSFVVSALAMRLAARRHVRSQPLIAAGALALAAGLVGDALTAISYAHLAFGPQSGAYASIFFGTTSLLGVVSLCSLYRIECLVARAIRGRDGGSTLHATEVQTAAFLATLIAALALVAWVVLYVL